VVSRYLELRVVDSSGEVAELQLDGAGLGSADLNERRLTTRNVDAVARNIRLTSETRTQRISQCSLHRNHTHRSTQPCIPSGSLNRVPASAGVRAGMYPLRPERQVTLWHVSSRSDVATLRTAIHLLLTYTDGHDRDHTRPPSRHTCCTGITHTQQRGSAAEWLACWTQAQKGPSSDRSRDDRPISAILSALD